MKQCIRHYPPMITRIRRRERLDAPRWRGVGIPVGPGVTGLFISGSAARGRRCSPETRQAMIARRSTRSAGASPCWWLHGPGRAAIAGAHGALEGLGVEPQWVTPPFYYGTATPMSSWRTIVPAERARCHHGLQHPRHDALAPRARDIARWRDTLHHRREDSSGDVPTAPRVELRPQGFWSFMARVGPVVTRWPGLTALCPPRATSRRSGWRRCGRRPAPAASNEARALERQVPTIARRLHGGVLLAGRAKGRRQRPGLVRSALHAPILTLRTPSAAKSASR
jgi:hypothetical protein